jgi:biotin transport system substrate-specific component
MLIIDIKQKGIISMSHTSIMTRNLVLAALFAALLAISGQLAIPIGPVPITLQTLIVMLAGAVLGSRWGATSVFIWILLAAIGAPVLTGGKGGVGALFGPTGGYIFGFLLAAFIIGWVIERLNKQKPVVLWQLIIVFILGGSLVIHAIGFPWFLFSAKLSFSTDIFYKSFVVFLPGDIIKVVLAAVLTMSLFRAMPQLRDRSSEDRSQTKSNS